MIYNYKLLEMSVIQLSKIVVCRKLFHEHSLKQVITGIPCCRILLFETLRDFVDTAVKCKLMQMIKTLFLMKLPGKRSFCHFVSIPAKNR